MSEDQGKYRKEFFALMTGYGMDEIDQYLLFGGIVNELQQDSNIKIARLRGQVQSANRVVIALREFYKALDAVEIDLEDRI